MNMLNNFKFGSVKDNTNIKFFMSTYGIATFDCGGAIVAFDKDNEELINVNDMIFDGLEDFIYMMPIDASKVKKGDTIISSGGTYFITKLDEKEIIGISAENGVKCTIVPTRLPFGDAKFVTKVFSLMDMNSLMRGEGKTANPPDMLNTLMLLSMLNKKDGGSNDNDFFKIMLLMNLGLNMNLANLL